MRKAIAVIALFFTLALAGCQSQKQKQADLSAAYQTATDQYRKDCSAPPSDQDANAIVGAALGSKPSPQQQSAVDQRLREAEDRKSTPHCKELDAKRDSLTKQMLLPQNQ